MPLVNACSTFLYLEKIGKDLTDEKDKPDLAGQKTTKELKNDTKLVNLLRNAVDSAEGDDGWSPLSTIGHHLSNQATFDPRNFGYRKLSDLIEAIELFKIDIRGAGVVFVRDKRRRG